MIAKKEPNPCPGPGCTRDIRRAGLCNPHYLQKLKGVPLAFIPTRRRPGAAGERDDQGRKWCSACTTWRPTDGFHASTMRVDGLALVCKGCQRCALHGITLADYERMLAAQEGVCVGCSKPGGDRPLSIDHDHSCCPGKRSCGRCVRGLLCANCNAALGLAGDDPATLSRLAEYASKHQN